MKKYNFFLTSIFATLIALGLHFGSHDQSVKSTSIRAHSWNHNETEKQQMKAEADRCASRADGLFYTGLAFSFAGLVSMIIAHRRKEQLGWYWIPMLLLLLDFLVQRLL